MSIQLVCPKCRTQLAVSAQSANQLVRCPACRTLLVRTVVARSVDEANITIPERVNPSAPVGIARLVTGPPPGPEIPVTGLTPAQKVGLGLTAATVLVIV